MKLKMPVLSKLRLSKRSKRQRKLSIGSHPETAQTLPKCFGTRYVSYYRLAGRLADLRYLNKCPGNNVMHPS